MTVHAKLLLDEVRAGLADVPGPTAFLTAVRAGRLTPERLRTLGLELHRLSTSDRDTFRWLARNAAEPGTRAYFDGAAEYQAYAVDQLATFTTSCGLTEAQLAEYRPQALCHGYASYVGWLAVHADPTSLIVSLTVNLPGWATVCAALGSALREQHGLDDSACAFFDLLATPTAPLEEATIPVVQVGLDEGADVSGALDQARLLRDYEVVYWSTLAP